MRHIAGGEAVRGPIVLPSQLAGQIIDGIATGQVSGRLVVGLPAPLTYLDASLEPPSEVECWVVEIKEATAQFLSDEEQAYYLPKETSQRIEESIRPRPVDPAVKADQERAVSEASSAKAQLQG